MSAAQSPLPAQLGNLPMLPGALLVLGQCNPHHPTHGRHDLALFSRPLNSAGGRLMALARDAMAVNLPTLAGLGTRSEPAVLAEWQWLAMAERHNLCDLSWNDPAARERAARIRGQRNGRPVLLLGRRVLEAWGLGEAVSSVPVATAEAADAAFTYVIPHTSGRNRTWQNEGIYSASRLVLAQAMAEAILWSKRGIAAPPVAGIYQ